MAGVDPRAHELAGWAPFQQEVSDVGLSLQKEEQMEFVSHRQS